MRKRPFLAIAFGMLLLPAICSAQRAAQWRDSVQRIDRSLKALNDSLLQGDSSATEVARRGDLVIAASPNEQATAATELDKFASIRDRWFAGALPATGGFRITLTTGTNSRAVRATGVNPTGVLVLSGGPDSGNAIRTRTSMWQSTPFNVLVDTYGRVMIESVPSLSAWLQNPPPLSQREHDRDQAMYAFVTATGPIQRRCVAGGLVACQVAMRIVPEPAMSHGGTWSPFMRADLLYFTLDLGGPGAWQRLQSATDTGVAAALAAAARMPIDSVLSRWRIDLLSHRPTVAVITPGSAILATTWTVLFLFGALGASKWT